MPVIALWSPPRARSTAFFRAMLERGDLLVLHEPFCNIMDHGETDADGQHFEGPTDLLAWLHERLGDDPGTERVFLKDTTDRRHPAVLADDRFLRGARHAFLIRRPEEIAASHYAIRPEMGIEEIGLEALHEMYAAATEAATSEGGHRPVVVDSDDLVERPEATMAAFSVAVGLPHRPEALRWVAGDRPEWRRTAEWHADVASSTGIARREQRYEHTVESSELLARFAAHHRPFYDRLRAHRLDVG